jgi:hypothetical protein
VQILWTDFDPAPLYVWELLDLDAVAPPLLKAANSMLTRPIIDPLSFRKVYRNAGP